LSGRNTNDQIRNSCFAGASMGHDQVPTCQRSFLVNKGDMSFIIMLHARSNLHQKLYQ